MSTSEIVLQSGKKATTALKRASRPLKGIWPRTTDAVLGMFTMLIIAFALLTYVTPIAVRMSEIAASNKYTAFIEGMLNPFRTRQLLLNSGLPIYDLEIKRQELAAIERKIEEAKAQGYMTEDQQIWANGRFFYNGEAYNVQVRVRGDLPSHWEDPKKSWRIKFGNQKLTENGVTVEEPIYFQGKRQINLIIPGDRDYIVAPLVNDLMEEAGLVTPHDQYAVLRINGIVQGLYYEVEHFDKPLLAANERPETTIFGQNGRSMHFEQYSKLGTAISSDAKYDMASLGLQVEETGDLAMQGLRAMEVLNTFSRNPTPANFRRVRAVLDWEKYLAFRNITTLFNTNHVRFGSDNLKLYFDTSRGLLEPVPWDVHLVRMPHEPGTIDFWNDHGPDELQRATLIDPQLRLQRNQMLWQWVSDGGDALIDQFTAWHEKIRPLAWADVLSTPVHGYNMDVLKKDFTFNVRRIYKILSTSSANATYRLETPERASLEIASLNFSGVQLQAVELSDANVFAGAYQLFQDVNDNGEWDTGDPLVTESVAQNGVVHFDLDHAVLPEVQYAGDTIDGRYWEFMDTLSGRVRFFIIGQMRTEKSDPLTWIAPTVHIDAVNAVTTQPIPSGMLGIDALAAENSIGILAYDASEPFDLEAPELSLAEFLEAHPEFNASRQQPGAVELSGQVTIAGTVIVPKTTPLILQPGVDITMQPEANILAYGGLTAVGTAEKRIRIHGDGSGEPWGVLAVVRAPKEVVIEYADISGAGQAQINSILFTGGLAVHNSDLRIVHTTVTDMQSEDGFNLKNGKILMEDCLIARNASDGVDLDFVTGLVRNNRFIDQVNDGLDISGSEVLIINNRFERNGDKGLSVGENSSPIVINALFLGNNLGASFKDLSHARFAYTTFIGNKLAVEAKRKKPFFGGGSGEIVNSVFAENQLLFEDDYFSRGQVQILTSIADDLSSCSTCALTDIQFQAPGQADYRLASTVGETQRLAAAQLEWLQVDDMVELPQMPGIFLEPISNTQK